jgi:hypothetical protein
LLQNENGPCPLLAAANCLLLKGSISLPSNIIGAGVVRIDQLVNVLAERILANATGSDQHNHEVLTDFPNLQYGLDVNPKFTSGPTGVEYTMQLNAFDLLHVELVHGWLLEPEAEEYDLIHNQTYNQLVNIVIQGNDASTLLQLNPNADTRDELATQATKGSIIHQFLERSSHQLTQYGLTVLHEYLKDGQMFVFFRNNHFNTLTKHDGLLYLLVTDFGYADVASVVWEKLDVIDGDTEYVTEDFKPPASMGFHPVSSAATGNQLLDNSMQSQADYQLALQLSREHACVPMTPQQDPMMEAARRASLLEQANNGGTTTALPPAAAAPNAAGGIPTVAVGIPAEPPSQEQRDLMLAMQIQRQEQTDRGQQRVETESSRQLARAMQKREKKKEQQRVSRPGPPPQRLSTAPPENAASSSNCVIS